MARHARRLILWTAGVLLSLVLLALVGIGLLLWGVDPAVLRGRIEQAATQSLGRRVELAGPLRWRPGLRFQIEIESGRVANAEGFGATPLASWQVLRLGVALRPLLDRRVVIDHVELRGLRLGLVRGAQGVNWQLPATSAGAEPSTVQVQVGSVALRDGSIAFTDIPAQRGWSATGINLDARLPPHLDAAELEFTGISLDARVAGTALPAAGAALELKLPAVRVQPARLHFVVPRFTLRWDDATFGGDVDASLGDAPAARGTLQLQAPSLRRLMQSVAVEPPRTRDGAVLGVLDLRLAFDAAAGAINLSGVDARLDSTRLTGSAQLPTLRPLSLRFELAADEVNLDRYLSPEDEPGKPLELPLADLAALDASGVLRIRRAMLAGAAAREMRIDVD